MATKNTRTRVAGFRLGKKFAYVTSLVFGVLIFSQLIQFFPSSILDLSVEDAMANVSTAVGSIYYSAPAAGTYGPVGRAYGIAAGGGLTSLSSGERSKLFDDMEDFGIKWIRLDFDWSGVQYNGPNDYQWRAYDRIVKEATDHHMQVLGIIDYTPPWARVDGCTAGAQCAPKDPAQYAAFAAKVADRYKYRGVHYWEIWNEPNLSVFWRPTADCKQYTEMLKMSYAAIKAADQYATVITGGLSPAATDGKNMSPIDFLSCIYASGGKGSFDAVSNHPYTFPQLPSSGSVNAWKRMVSTTPSFRSIMIANGDADKKIWITEFGVPTGGPDSNWYVSEARQADTLTDAVKMYSTYDWAGPFFWYSYKDAGNSTNTNENFFGVVRSDYSRKPVFDAFLDLF